MNKKDFIFKKRKSYYLLSFLIPLAVFILFLIAIHAYPFGSVNSFVSDANAYYINYVSYWKRVLHGQESFFYSFTKGIGGSTSGLVAYHLLNPFMVLFAFVDIEQFPLVYTIVSLLSVSACGLSMYVLLDHIRPVSGSNLIFSTAYALMGYNAVNYWQLQWLSGAILFPLIVLGIYFVFKKRSPFLYIISLACSLMMNFYIGYMCTIGAVLIIIVMLATRCYEINSYDSLANVKKEKRNLFFSFLFATILAGLLSLFIWLPALLSLRGGRASTSDLFTFSFTENNKLLAIFSKLFTGMYSSSELRNGLPAIFSGILPLFLCVLFFADKSTEKKKKTAAAILLIIYLLSFYIHTLSVIFQGFSYTVWFNYRYSFIFSFLVIMTAFDEAGRFLEWKKTDIQKTIAVLIIAVLLIFAENLEFADKPYYLIDLGLLAAVLGAFYLYFKSEKKDKKAFISICLICSLINEYANIVISTQELDDSFFSNYSDTRSGIEIKKALVNSVTDQDSSFYRMESELNRAGGQALDPMMFDYNGVSLAGSVEKNFVKQSIIKFGVGWFDNRNFYMPGMSASMDSLLGIKYLISSRDLEEEKHYELMKSVTGINIYKNPYALSPVMLSNDGIDKLDISENHDVFEIQNQVWSAMTGENENLYSEEKSINYTSHNPEESVTINSQEDQSSQDISSQETTGLSEDWEDLGMDSVLTDQGQEQKVTDNDHYVLVECNATYDGPYYLYAYGYVDGEYGSAYKTLYYLGNYKKGDKVTAKLPLENTVTRDALTATAENTYVACLNLDLLKEYSSIMNNRSMTVEKSVNDDSHISGTFTSDENQKLFFTIPYDEGWTLTIDDKSVTLTKSLGLFMVADAPKGTHTYKLVFFPQGLKAGIIISCSALAVFIIWMLKDKKIRLRF